MASLKRFGGLVEKLVPILMLTSIALAFAIGILWNKVASLESGQTKSVGSQAGANAVPTSAPAEGPTQGKLSDDQAKKVPQVTENDHVRGGTSPQVYLVEYSDLECPFCKQFHLTAQQVVADYKGQVAWVFRHYPIAQLHSQAPKEAEAVECAYELGGDDAFWKLTDKIYEVTPANNGLDLKTMSSLASSTGLNKAKFQTCWDSGKYKDKIAKEMQDGTTAGVTGTPGNFIINSKGEVWLIPGALPLDSIKTVIDEALAS